ncbi:unnamed protein product [Rotaria sp. Silwood2]|nr:unnamed protein product [Rotaria sp. Silwood2]
MIPIEADMCMKKNMEEHSTIYYDIQGLILRRGQPFSFIITFNQDFHTDKYNLSVIFKSKTWMNIPSVKIPLNDSSNGWSAKTLFTEDQKNNHICFQIDSPSDAIIGKYSLLLEISSMTKDLINQRDLSIFQFDIDIYFLFNPWNKNDSCALLSSDQIVEYVMNEHGEIYLGSSEIPRSIPWYFGQFEGVVLLTALALLNEAHLSIQHQIDTSLILRILSSKICSNLEIHNGIFPSPLNRHSFSYQENGYTSSPAILKQLWLLNDQSFQGDNGSNWQHAAVFCSLCRSLGIPCRIVTVYNAICRIQEKENIDVNWNTRQRPTVVVNSKLTHPWYLWNECWMRRDDLPEYNSGWQVVDSSFIEYNTNIRHTGPCSVAALKSATLGLKWNTADIYSVLNGNKIYWLVYPNGNRKLINIEENVIDTKILTRSLKTENEYEDITSNYKLNKSSNPTALNHDVNIEIEVPHSLKFGDDLHLILKTNNLSNEHRTLTVAFKLVKINPIQEVKSALKTQSQTLHQDQYIPSNSNLEAHNISSQTPIQSFSQVYHLDNNDCESDIILIIVLTLNCR